MRIVRITALLIVSLFCALSLADAGQQRKFYKEKKKGLSFKAYARAEKRLLQVRPGMATITFLTRMEMEILQIGGRDRDVKLEGYLAETSKRANLADPRNNVKHYYFGFVKDGQTQPRRHVTTVNGFVLSIREVGESSATPPVAVTVATPEPTRAQEPTPNPEPPPIVVAEPVTIPTETVDPEAEVRRFVESWRVAWETRDLERFMSCYSRRFRTEKRSRDEFAEHKKKVFASAGDIEVRLDRIVVVDLGDQYEVRFDQHYRSARYRDVGVKTLTVTHESGDHRILIETWTKLATD